MSSMPADDKLVAAEALVGMDRISVVLKCLSVSLERLSIPVVEICLCHRGVVASGAWLVILIRLHCPLQVGWNPAHATILFYHLFRRGIVDVALFEHRFEDVISVGLR